MSYDYNKTHELILKSAEEQFQKEGFRNASIRRICSDAGVTNGAFYAHFDSKEALFKELVEPAVEGLNINSTVSAPITNIQKPNES